MKIDLPWLLLPSACLLLTACGRQRIFFEGVDSAEAHRRVRVAMPEDARDICFFEEIREVQQLDRYLRFTCETARCDRIVADLLKREGDEGGHVREVLAPPFSCPAPVDPQLIPWWNLEESRVTKAILSDRSYVYQVWEMPVSGQETQVYLRMRD